MDVNVIVAAGTTSTIDTASYRTIGAIADAVADEHAISGSAFTLKVNGYVHPRDEPPVPDIDQWTLELVEYQEPGPTDTSTPNAVDAADAPVTDDRATSTTSTPEHPTG